MKQEFVSKDIDILLVMQSKINGCYTGKVYISDLIYDLESLLNPLQTIDEEWKTDFRTSWINIEVAFALALAAYYLNNHEDLELLHLALTIFLNLKENEEIKESVYSILAAAVGQNCELYLVGRRPNPAIIKCAHDKLANSEEKL